MDEINKCAHKMCDCAVAEDVDYCCKQCEDAADQDMTEIDCDCGHSACG